MSKTVSVLFLAAGLLTGLAQASPPASSSYDQPVKPPVPTYPAAAIAAGKSGSCAVTFNVTPEGQPEDVRADCTDPVFVKSAEAAMRAVHFAPKIIDGEPVARTAVVYPIEYRLD